LGGVSIFGGSGVWRLSIPAQPGTRLGLDIADVPDQDADGSPRSCSSRGAVVQPDGRWAPRLVPLLRAGPVASWPSAPKRSTTLTGFAKGGGALYLPGDLDDSGSIDSLDLGETLGLLGVPVASHPEADLNHDGVITTADLQLQINGYLAGQRSIMARDGGREQ